MTITIEPLVIKKTYEDDYILSEQNLDDAFIKDGETSVQSYLNTFVVNNLIQLAKDIMPEDWVFNNNGDKSVNNTLFDKQTDGKTHSTSELPLGTASDVGFVTVDMVNAAITFTPEFKGKYKVSFDFTVDVKGSGSNPTDVFEHVVLFRITDGYTASYAKACGSKYTIGATEGEHIYPFSISHIFEWDSASAKTIYLQKLVIDATNIDEHFIASNSGADLQITVEKI